MPNQAHSPGYCRGCSYDLRGLSEHRCPECGRPFDPANPRTYRRRPRAAWVRILFRLAMASVALLLALTATFFVWRGKKIAEYEREQAALKSLVAIAAIPGGKYHVDAPEWLDRRLGHPEWLRRETVVSFPTKHYSTSAELQPLHGLKFLRELQFGVGGSMTIEAARTLAGLNELRYLYMERLTVPCDPLKEIRVGKMVKLERLLVSDTSVTDRGLEELAPLTHLKELHISNANLQGVGIVHLRSLHQLEKLAIGGNPGVGDDATAVFAGLESLRELYVEGTSISDRGIEQLSRHPCLEVLFISRTQVTGGCVSHLAAMRRLRILAVSRRETETFGLSQDEVRQLRETRPDIRIDDD